MFDLISHNGDTVKIACKLLKFGRRLSRVQGVVCVHPFADCENMK